MSSQRRSLLFVATLFLAGSPLLFAQDSGHRSNEREIRAFAGQFPKSIRPAAASQTVDVSVGPGFVFNPGTVNITAGDTVRWTWKGSNHSVTSGNCCTSDNQFCSPNDTSCDTAALSNAPFVYSHTFGQAGTFPYYCRAHAGLGMVGTVNVAAPPVLVTAVTLSGGHFVISGVTHGGLSVSVTAAPDLVSQPTPLGTAQADSNGFFQFDETVPLGQTVRFYRVTFP